MDISYFYNKKELNKELINILETELSDLYKKRKTITNNIITVGAVKKALIVLSDTSRNKAIKTLTNTVNTMLKDVLTDKYKFSIESYIYSNKPALKFYIVEQINDEESKQDIEADTGGGIQDIVSTALRYSFMLLFNGGIKAPLILDEPARMLSEEKGVEYVKFLSNLAAHSDKQMILCTHNSLVKDSASNVIEIFKENSSTKIFYEKG